MSNGIPAVAPPVASGGRALPARTAAAFLGLTGGPVVVAAALASGRRPLLVLATVAGAAAVALMLAKPRLALLLLIAVGPLESALPVAEDASLTSVKAVGALCFAAFALDAVLRRRPIRFDWSHGVLALLLALALVSSLGARSSGDAFTTTLRYASFAGLYFVATQAADRKLAVSITWVASASAAVAAILAVRRFVVGDANLAEPLNGDPNDLAFVLATTIPLTFWLLRTPGFRRVVVLAMLTATGLGVVLSLSRGALLALAVGGLWHAATQRRHIPVLAVGIAVAAAVALFASDSVDRRVEEGLALKANIAQENVETRLGAWRAAAELTAEHPIDGVGPGNFGLYYLEATGRPPGTQALRVVHDAYLDVAVELGITGLLLFGSFLAITFHRAGAAVRRGVDPPGLAPAVRTAMVVALVAALTLSEQYFPPFWVLGGLATILWRCSEERFPAPEAGPPSAVAPVAPAAR